MKSIAIRIRKSPLSDAERGFRGEVFCSLSLLFIAFTLFSSLSFAQDDTPPVIPDGVGVTFDQVNAIAEKMFCPECENVPLDKCSTVVCIQWKEEIASRLAQGQTETEIIDYFVSTFGNRVVDVPQDPFLRTLSLIGPWILAGVILLIGLTTFVRLRGTFTPQDTFLDDENEQGLASTDQYREQLERDLNG